MSFSNYVHFAHLNNNQRYFLIEKIQKYKNIEDCKGFVFWLLPSKDERADSVKVPGPKIKSFLIESQYYV